MKTKNILLWTLAVLALPATGMARADHLLISELLVNPSGTQTDEASAEYIELYNPTQSSIDLSNYYLTDYQSYYALPAGSFDYGDRSDFMLRFPAGATIAPSATVVISQNSTTFVDELGSKFGGSLAAFTNQLSAPILYEVKNASGIVPDMINLKSAQPRPNTLSMTSAGGFVTVFYWDGASDLVQDVDIVRWGTPTSTEAFLYKTGIAVDGPDAGSVATAYKADMGASANVPSGSVTALKRVNANETGEAATGGNGITGNDESMENIQNTFASNPETAITPGPPNVGVYRAAVSDWQVY